MTVRNNVTFTNQLSRIVRVERSRLLDADQGVSRVDNGVEQVSVRDAHFLQIEDSNG